MTTKSLRTCPVGHKYHKSTDCPTYPVCEALKKPKSGFLSTLSAPACRALVNAGISSAKELSRYSQKEIMALHGMGPASLPKLQAALKEAGLDFSS